MTTQIALVHDYLTQRGGAERVVLSMAKAFPSAPIYTSMYAVERTFPEFSTHQVRTLPLNRVAILRRHHRLAFPALAPSFQRLVVDAKVVVCSSSGWAHGVRTAGRKVVYCYTPARWLYQTERYFRELPHVARVAGTALAPHLRRWDHGAVRTAHRFLTSSRAIRDEIREQYGVEADILPPPVTIDPNGSRQALAGLEPGFVLCVSRLQPYKNVDVVIGAFEDHVVGRRLVVVGEGPDRGRLEALCRSNAELVGSVSDAELRWLYANCSGLVAASHEDFGLTPLEAAAFGKPAAVLRWGGFLDTVIEGRTGLFFNEPSAASVAAVASQLERWPWDVGAIHSHAARYSESHFIATLQNVVDEELDIAERTTKLQA